MLKCHRNPCSKTTFVINLVLLAFIAASFYSFAALSGDLESLSQPNSTRHDRDKGRTAIGVLSLASVLTIVFITWIICLSIAGCVPNRSVSRSRTNSFSNLSNATSITKGTSKDNKRHFSKRKGSNHSEKNFLTLPKNFVSKYKESESEDDKVDDDNQTSMGRTRQMDFRVIKQEDTDLINMAGAAARDNRRSRSKSLFVLNEKSTTNQGNKSSLKNSKKDYKSNSPISFQPIHTPLFRKNYAQSEYTYNPYGKYTQKDCS